MNAWFLAVAFWLGWLEIGRRCRNRLSMRVYQSSIFSRINNGERKNSSKLMSSPSQISYMIRNFMLGKTQFIMVLNVDCGTPLFIDNWYCVIFFSLQSMAMRFATASFSFMASTPIATLASRQYYGVAVHTNTSVTWYFEKFLVYGFYRKDLKGIKEVLIWKK